MTNDESKPNDRNSNDEMKTSPVTVSSFGHLYFEFDSSFVIRVSSLAIDRIVFLLAAASRQFLRNPRRLNPSRL
jgi:hypothetical protein